MPGEECSDGLPTVCSAGCAGILLPFWNNCHGALGKDADDLFEAAVALCEATSGAGVSLAEQLNVQCIDGTDAAEYVPTCSEEFHGFLMLLNIEGDDSKLSCELHRGLYSWVGAAVSPSNNSRNRPWSRHLTCFGLADGRRLFGL